ncbi:exocyst complex component EXO70A1-like [Papaver somniferum]|uniref:exocyst complex component EXO70A1-like n=1 Tax=Papaver somniferum TaxID=3469 RepID=UPI000E6FBB4C|nr:exocyst complex component EXO70A1-like [Papaver somniferum]
MSSSPTFKASPEESSIAGAEKVIFQCVDFEKMMLFDGNHHQEAEEYLQAVGEIQKSLKSCAVSISTDRNGGQSKAIKVAMAILEGQFKNLLNSHSKIIETEWILSTNSVNSRDGKSSARSLHKSLSFDYLVSGETDAGSSTQSSKGRGTSTAINDLRRITERMVGAGYTRECVQGYTKIRKLAIESFLHHLDFQNLSTSEVQELKWDVLNDNIDIWIRAANSCIKILFASEKTLSEQIFKGFEWMNVPADEGCFYETVQAFSVELLKFVNVIRTPEGLLQNPQRFCKILDLHDSASKLKPDFEEVFDSQFWVGLRGNVNEIITSLADAARRMLIEFEKCVIEYSERHPVLGGTIHPLTRYVMNFISLASDYKDTLVELIVSNPVIELEPSHPIGSDLWLLDTENKSPLAVHMVWIVLNLVQNLDVRSQRSLDLAMSHLFIMSNTHYIVKKVKEGSEVLREMIGDKCLKKLSVKIKDSARDYRSHSLGMILDSLTEAGLRAEGTFFSGVSINLLRERFNRFNSSFAYVHRIQVTWSIPDEELRLSISQILVPAYQAFLGRYRGQIEKGKHPGLYIKYEAEEVEDAVMGFFQQNQIRHSL